MEKLLSGKIGSLELKAKNNQGQIEFIQNWLTLENGRFRCHTPFYRGNSDASPMANNFIWYRCGFLFTVCGIQSKPLCTNYLKHICWWKCKLVQLFWKTVQNSVYKLYICISYDPAFSFPVIQRTKFCTNAYQNT